MRAGSFNIDEYLEKLNEAAEGGNLPDKEGMVIPEENQKAYQWLKKEYQKAQTEVKVEINMGGSKFEPGYDLQTDLKSIKEFKPGMFGEVKTADTSKTDTKKKPSNLDVNKEKPSFQKQEGENKKEEKDQENKSVTKTKVNDQNIKDKEENSEKDEGKVKVKKMDLKTKKDGDKE